MVEDYQRTMLKKSISDYRNYEDNFVYLIEPDFRGVFDIIMDEKGINSTQENFDDNLDNLIEMCSEEECLRLNKSLDHYSLQINLR